MRIKLYKEDKDSPYRYDFTVYTERTCTYLAYNTEGGQVVDVVVRRSVDMDSKWLYESACYDKELVWVRI